MSAALLVACSSDSNDNTSATGGGSLTITASAEALGLTGYSFPPASGQEVFFVDGWQIRFEHVITTIDQITLSSGADTNLTDKSQVGTAVASLDGPFAVDLHTLSAADDGGMVGKGGSGELAITLGTLSNQNLNGGQAFSDTERYAFGFKLIPALASAKKVNLNAEATTLYDEMISKGYTHYFVGTATWEGASASCITSDQSLAEGERFDFSTLPSEVHFKFGLNFTGALSQINCENPDNQGEPVQGEEFQRGVFIRANEPNVAQVTVHTDHIFWDSLVHDSPAHFDAFALFAKNTTGGKAEVTLEDLAAADFTSFSLVGGKPLPWRSCVDSSLYTLPTSNPMNYQDNGLGLKSFEQFVETAAATMGHLNADGLCYVSGVGNE
ncbi:MAG: hypothetical protein U0165_09180 [Polyangiaceae bacterium]